jgi:two-component system cell cycle response regulator DivK
MPRILYIEDNRENRMLVRRVLMASDYDFVVQEADNAQRGIEMAQADPPDLILMDLSMPEMDGLTATQRIRSLPGLSEIPIIALTANAMHGDRERSLNAGCDGYISKPIDVDKLPDDVFSFVGKPRPQPMMTLTPPTVPVPHAEPASAPTSDMPVPTPTPIPVEPTSSEAMREQPAP